MQRTLVGMQIGEYVVGQPLAEGGMGAIFQAFRAGSKEPLAIKILLPEYNQDGEYRKRFQREAALMQALNHPNIIPVYAYGEQQGMLYFVMHLVRGPSLSDLMARRHFTPATAWQILNPIGKALDYAHSCGVIHRDIKPGNIMVEVKGQGAERTNHVFLGDFGLSKRKGASMLTKIGMTLGTPHYMSPEQVLARQLTPPSDIYSLAVVIYEMLLGRLPFDGNKPEEIAFQHVDNEVPPPSSLNPNFPPSLERVLLRALAKKPEDRYTRASEFSVAYAFAAQSMSPEERQGNFWVAAPPQ